MFDVEKKKKTIEKKEKNIIIIKELLALATTKAQMNWLYEQLTKTQQHIYNHEFRLKKLENNNETN